MAVISNTELAGIIGADAETATRLLKLAMEIVTRYVNNSEAPEVTLRMRRVIRLCGWLYESPANRTSQIGIGPDISLRFNLSQNSALRHSGAMSLLSPYKRRRASPIG